MSKKKRILYFALTGEEEENEEDLSKNEDLQENEDRFRSCSYLAYLGVRDWLWPCLS